MTQLILKTPISRRKLNSLVIFLNSLDIDTEIQTTIRQISTKKTKAMLNRTYAPTDDELEARLSGSEPLFAFDSTDDYKEIVKTHRPVLSEGLEKWL